MVERTIMRSNKTDYSKKYNDSEKSQEEVKEIFTPVEEISETEVYEESEPIISEAIVDIDKNQTLNLRSEMSTDSDVITTLQNGKHVMVDESFSDWHHVTTETGATGYVMAQFIKFI